jgi:hypothetical protein
MRGIRAAAGIAALGLAGLGLAAPRPPAESGAGGPVPPVDAPVLAAEDTFQAAPWRLPEYLVRATRVTLDEILRRVAEGEVRRDSLMRDQSFTRVALITYLDEDGARPRRKLDLAAKVYKRQPDHVREVPLRRRTDRPDEDRENVRVTASADMGEEFVAFAFEPRARASYRFRIVERHWVDGHVVYLVEFEPRSRVDPLPSGRAWIDANEFVIVREEFWYRDRSPAPLFLKSIDRCVIERTRVDGRWWVVSRVVGRARLTSALRFMGKLGRDGLPPVMDFSLLCTDYRINQGIPDSVFAERVR